MLMSSDREMLHCRGRIVLLLSALRWIAEMSTVYLRTKALSSVALCVVSEKLEAQTSRA